MSATYLNRIIEVLQSPNPERNKVFTYAPGAGDLTVVTGASGVRTRVYTVGISCEADAVDVVLTLKDGATTLDEKTVPKKTIADFEWKLDANPWWLAAGADLVLTKSAAPLQCRVSVQYDAAP